MSWARNLAAPRSPSQRTALASLTELGYCIHVARRLEYITEDARTAIDLEMRRVATPLRGLLRGRESVSS
jgi:hypothetical protein